MFTPALRVRGGQQCWELDRIVSALGTKKLWLQLRGFVQSSLRQKITMWFLLKGS